VSSTFLKIQTLVNNGEIKVSSHGYDEMAEDYIFVKDIMSSILDGNVIEDYPEFGKGPCVLVLQHDRDKKPIHVVWGIPKGNNGPAVIVTAYRPDPDKWADGYMRRKK
jgi:hypothetical protein